MKYHYGPRFRVLHWCTEQIMSAALAQMDLTSAQGHIMGFLVHQEGPPCSRDIEEAFHLSHPTVSGTLRRMEKKGFIEFRSDETDRRCKRIHILPKGIQCHAEMEKCIRGIEQQVVQDFTPEEEQLFSRFLDRAIANMGGNPCPPPPLKEEL
ncbi:MAG: MarR family transcriptional regulator [Oscillospiraceae bacterium]|nr:MarR family transcriptional regulator [Oscillospiraceae bacterium]